MFENLALGRMVNRRALETNRPVSNAGDAMGPSSVVIWKIPSKGRSENGFATSAETLASTLETRAYCQCHNSIFK